MIPIPSLPVTSWLKLGAAAAVAVAVLWVGYEFNRRGERIATLERDAATYRAAVQTFTSANEAWARADALRRAAMQRDREQRQQVQAQAQAAAAAARASAIEADNRARLWRDKFNTRPQGCAAALAALDSACPSLRGF